MQLILNEQTRSKRKGSWTKEKIVRSGDIKAVIDELKDYWPLTVRQVYYRLISSKCLSNPHWLNKGKQKGKPLKDYYAALKPILKWMRIDDYIPFESITDEHRILTQKLGFSNARDFIDNRVGALRIGYDRCNAQKQERHIEIWIEKATLLHIIEPVADEFCRRVMVARGYDSITFQERFYHRAAEALNLGMIPTVLYFGDWDPSGVNMIYAAIQTLTDELGMFGVEYYRCGINPKHFSMIDADPVPIKPKDTRSKKFIKEHGPTAYELDAFHPEQLKILVRDSIKSFTDMINYRANVAFEQIDRRKIALWRVRVSSYAQEVADELGI